VKQPPEAVEGWWRRYTNPDDPGRVEGTTSQQTFSEVVDLSRHAAIPPAFDAWLAQCEAGCRRAKRIKGREWHAQEALRLISVIRSCFKAHDEAGAAEAGVRLGEHVADWRIKDHVEPEYVRGGKNLRHARAAAKVRGKNAAEDSRAAEWAAQVVDKRPGDSDSQVYLRIAREDDPHATDGPDVKRAVQRVKKAVQRYRQRQRRR
jgi:hypothetical protein